MPGLPHADFTFSVNNLTVQFTDASTGDNIMARAWSFGDGATSTAQSPAHTYGVAGTYTVTLAVTNSDGGNTTSKSVTVSAQPTPTPIPKLPDAGFTFSVNNQTVQFTDTSTGDNIAAWLWNFGDNTTSTAQHPTHTYGPYNKYIVTLTVTNAVGSDNTSQYVAAGIPPAPPRASFVFDTYGLEVHFADKSAGDFASAWYWDFGDGKTTTEHNPWHTYSAPGNYTVKLTVTNPGGSDSVSQSVIVAPLKPYVPEWSPTPTVEPAATPFPTTAPTTWAYPSNLLPKNNSTASGPVATPSVKPSLTTERTGPLGIDPGYVMALLICLACGGLYFGYLGYMLIKRH